LFSDISHPSSADAPTSDRATALQADEEANHGHYPASLMFALPSYTDAGRVHLFSHRDFSALQVDE
jgi:hypothetical protein